MYRRFIVLLVSSVVQALEFLQSALNVVQTHFPTIPKISTPEVVGTEMVPIYKYLDVIINQHIIQTHIISNHNRHLN